MTDPDQGNAVVWNMLGIAFGWFLGFLTSLALPWVNHLIRGPRLKIDFVAEGYGLSEIRHSPGGFESTSLETQTTYVRVVVRNTGKTTANNCRAFLVDALFQADVDGPFERVYFDTISLCWSYLLNNSDQVIDIPAKSRMILDVAKSSSRDAAFSPALNCEPLMYKKVFEKKGTYLFRLSVTADNASATKLSLEVKWSGEGGTIESEGVCVVERDEIEPSTDTL